MITKRVKLNPGKAKRPVDKLIRFYSQNMDNSQDNVVLFTATFPCTLMGLRVTLSPEAIVASAGYGAFVVAVVQDGTSPGTIDLTNGNSLYEPEQNVLTCGPVNTWMGSSTGSGWVYEEVVKTKRKMKVGDALVLSTLGTSATATPLRATITFFVLT